MGEAIERPKLRRSPEAEQQLYDHYLTVLGLSDTDIARVRSICDIGSGANAFAAETRRRHPHVFVLGIEPAEQNYHVSHPTSINHEAGSIGLPDDVPKFDLTISVNAVPSYHEAAVPPTDTITDADRRTHDYSVFDSLARMPEAAIQADAIESMSQILRITKAGGRFICYPVLVSTTAVLSEEQFNEAPQVTFGDGLLALLKRKYPKYGFKLTVDVPATQEIREREKQAGEPATDTLKCRLEIRKRRE